jgi:hypothetical protein
VWGVRADATASRAEAPTIAAVTPTMADAAGGALLTITGADFLDTGARLQFRVGANPAARATWLSATALRCAAPPAAGAGSQAVDVTNNGALRCGAVRCARAADACGRRVQELRSRVRAR